MRPLSILCLAFLVLFSIGCGAGPGSRNQGPHFAVGVFPPVMTALTPGSVPVNSVPFTMTVDGNNFGTDAVVFWNGVPQHTTFVNSHQVLVALTDTDLMFVGTVRVYVRSGGMNSNTLNFDVTP